MKKFSFLFFMFCLLIITPASAQFSGFSLGGSMSVQSPKMKFSEDFEDYRLRELRAEYSSDKGYKTNSQFGWSIGLNAGADITEKLGLQFNVTYSNNKYEYEFDELVNYPVAGGPIGVFRFEEKLNTISVNPLLRIKPFDSTNGPYVVVGPHFSFGFAGNHKEYFDSGAEESVLIGEIQDLSFGNDRFSTNKGMTVGVTLGLGFSAAVNNHTRCFVELRRESDFSTQYSGARLDYLSSQDQRVIGKKKTRATVLKVGVAYLISLDK